MVTAARVKPYFGVCVWFHRGDLVALTYVSDFELFPSDLKDLVGRDPKEKAIGYELGEIFVNKLNAKFRSDPFNSHGCYK